MLSRLLWESLLHSEKASGVYLCAKHLQEKPEDVRQKIDHIMIYQVSYYVTQRSDLTKSLWEVVLSFGTV